jgi:hypothetical protein
MPLIIKHSRVVAVACRLNKKTPVSRESPAEIRVNDDLVFQETRESSLPVKYSHEYTNNQSKMIVSALIICSKKAVAPSVL